MDQDVRMLLEKIEAQEKKLDMIYRSAEKTRKYFLWTLIASLVLFILPLIGLLFVIPQYLQTLSGYTSGF